MKSGSFTKNPKLTYIKKKYVDIIKCLQQQCSSKILMSTAKFSLVPFINTQIKSIFSHCHVRSKTTPSCRQPVPLASACFQLFLFSVARNNAEIRQFVEKCKAKNPPWFWAGKCHFHSPKNPLLGENINKEKNQVKSTSFHLFIRAKILPVFFFLCQGQGNKDALQNPQIFTWFTY